jgi:hypothetical protein
VSTHRVHARGTFPAWLLTRSSDTTSV